MVMVMMVMMMMISTSIHSRVSTFQMMLGALSRVYKGTKLTEEAHK